MLTKYEIEEEKEDKFTSYVDQSELLNDAIRYYETLTPTRPVQIGPAVYDGPIFEYRPTQGGVNLIPNVELYHLERAVGTSISSCYIEEIEDSIPF